MLPQNVPFRRARRSSREWTTPSSTYFRHLACAAATALLTSCSENAPSTLHPAGPGAERVAELWWPMLWISLVVLLVVIALVAISLRRRGRLDEPPDDTAASWAEPFVILAGVVVPWIILASVFVLSLRTMTGLDGDAAAGDEKGRNLEILVEGHMWWWEVRYPNGAVTANEIHIPAGRPVVLRLATEDVLHSLWVPELQVKLDMVPGRVNDLPIQAHRPGRYRGQCAEYCGLQHAKMIFYVVAQPPETFAEWLAAMDRPADEPTTASASLGEDVFMGSSCIGCHAIRGTPAQASLGPDLTHLARRETIGAGILPLTRESVAEFVADPQGVKPGAMMPPTELTPAEMQALLDYLMDLD